ncbi:hypothetical protein ACGFZK_20765 [Streptomyces sp. NPDC048257]|uniref:hypothetical protein n=1 Tax=Streptomyces sp. NPDC048257 TaxID=3365526 RepID=UPI00371610F4
MARAGRPQGAPRGRTHAANELAELLREVTHGLSVRELAQRYGGGKTLWSEYRLAARIIPLGRLNLVVRDRVRDPRRQADTLARARRLHGRALTSEAEAGPAPGLEEALRQAQSDLTTSGRLVEALLAMMTIIEENAEAAPAAKTDDAAAPAGSDPPADPPADPATGRLPLGTEEVRDQLTAARDTETSARTTVAELRARCEAVRQAPTPAHRLPAPAVAKDRALSTDPTQLHLLVEQQREAARGLWERLRADHTSSRIVEGVVLERLDTLPGAPGAPGAPGGSVLPAVRLRPGAALPARRGGRRRGRGPGRIPVAVLGTALVLAVLAGVALAAVAFGRRHPLSTGATDVSPAPSPPLAGPAVPGTAPASPPAALPAPPPTTPPWATAAPGGGPRTSLIRPDRPPGPARSHTPAPPPGSPAPAQPSDTVYAVSPNRDSILQWTAQGGAKPIGSAADQVYAGAAGLFATRADDGRILKYDGSSSSWSQIGFPGEQFVTSGDGLYAITEQRNAVMRWTGQGADWIPIGGPATRLYAGGAGLFATNPDTGGLFRYAGYGYTWVEAGGPGADFAVGPDYVARISPDAKEIWQANAKGSQWHRIGGPARNLYAGGAGLFAVDPTGQILRYDGTPGAWSPIGAAGVGLAVGTHCVYRIETDGLSVSRWSGDGSRWTALGLSAGAIAAIG